MYEWNALGLKTNLYQLLEAFIVTGLKSMPVCAFDLFYVLKMISWQVKTAQFIQQHFLKTSKSVRQLYNSESDVDNKVRE